MVFGLNGLDRYYIDPFLFQQIGKGNGLTTLPNDEEWYEQEEEV